jgi:alkylhydroperoxidase family enzyme
MAAYLQPIAKPKGLTLKMGYWYTRKQFGAVPGPLSVFCARMPSAFTSFYGKVGKLDKKLALDTDTALLIRERVASVNACAYCMDANRWNATHDAPERAAKFAELDDYQTSTHFTDRERAALDYVSKLTAQRGVDRETFASLARHFSEREICDIVWLVASEHLYNLNNLALNIGSAGMCEAATAS